MLGGGGSPPDSRADTPMADRCPSFVRVDTNTARSNTGPPRRPLRSRIRLHGLRYGYRRTEAGVGQSVSRAKINRLADSRLDQVYALNDS